MKITVPAIKREAVGTRFSYAGSETVYFAGERPSQGGFKPKVTTVYDTTLTSKVAFDYDFQIARRVNGVAVLAFTGIFAAFVAVPVVIGTTAYGVLKEAGRAGYARLQYAGSVVGDVATAFREAVEYAVEEITAR